MFERDEWMAQEIDELIAKEMDENGKV